MRSVERRSEYALGACAALLFAVSAAATLAWSGSMDSPGMPMPGGWTMSMAWMRMPGQAWSAAAASFVGMWTVMMVAMMLPSIAPLLSRYRDTLADRGAARAGLLAALAGLAYFGVWAGIGVAAYPAGVALSALEMQVPGLARAVPFAAGGVVVAAGALQFTAWKQRHLACCRVRSARIAAWPAGPGAAWRYGMQLGAHCVSSSAGPTGVLLALGVMDLRAMAVVAAAITAERLAPASRPVTHAIGAAAMVAGSLLVARAAGLG